MLEQAKLEPVSAANLEGFQVLYFQDKKPKVGPVSGLPAGVTFYVEPSRLPGVSKDLGVKIRSSDHSRSRREQRILLEVEVAGGLERFRYLAGDTTVLPLARKRLSGSTISRGLGRGLRWAALALLLLPFLLLPRRQENPA